MIRRPPRSTLFPTRRSSDLYFLFLHGLGELPGDNLFHCLRLSLFKDPLRFQEVINGGSHVFLAHLINSFWRLRANAKSSFGVARVFLMKPCSATKYPWYGHNNTRAVRFVGKSVRISQRPPPIGRHRGIPTGQRHCALKRSFPTA